MSFWRRSAKRSGGGKKSAGKRSAGKKSVRKSKNGWMTVLSNARKNNLTTFKYKGTTYKFVKSATGLKVPQKA